MVSTRHLRTGRSQRGFTLPELLIVIAIIAVLTSMLIGSVVMIKTRLKNLETSNRMQSILSALADYQRDSGQMAMALQAYANLGGPLAFSNLDVIHNHNIAVSGSADPTFIAVTGGYGLMWGTDYWSSHQNQDYWDRIEDVVPTPGQVVPSGWYEQVWPFQWPGSDWQSGGTTNPVILPYPWGEPGLCLNGAICDPAQPATTATNQIIEFHDPNNAMSNNYNDSSTYNVIPVVNSMTVNGNPFVGSYFSWNSTDGSQSAPAGTTVTGTRSDGSIVSTTSNMAVPFDLGYLSPMQTVSLLQVIGVLAPGAQGLSDYQSNRSTKAPWNDSWGNPLVVVYAMFIPERYHRTYDVENQRDLLLRYALQAYTYNRAVYLAVAAAGPVVNPSISVSTLATNATAQGTATFLQQYWQSIAKVTAAQTWTEASFANPPWQGVKIATSNGQTCFLSSPIGVH